jgi:hypothetical protein
LLTIQVGGAIIQMITAQILEGGGVSRPSLTTGPEYTSKKGCFNYEIFLKNYREAFLRQMRGMFTRIAHAQIFCRVSLAMHWCLANNLLLN